MKFMTKKTAEKEEVKGSMHITGLPLQFDDAENVSIPDTIHLIPIGQWDHDAYGPIIINNSDIREFAQNFNAGIRKGVFITAGHEGFEELPAVGWITKVEMRDNGLWGDVEWNDEGKELLGDKAFKFFSPEFYRDYEDPQTHQLYRNVLTGGALTKSPYFKELEAIVFSEKKIKSKFNDNIMNLNELMAKDITTLSDEEKVFIKEHSAELSEEQKSSHASVIEEPKGDEGTETEEEKTAREAKEKADADAAAAKATEDANVAAGLNADGSEKEQVNASEKITVSALEFSILKKKADEGQQAFAELKKQKLDKAVSGLMFSDSNKAGKFLPKSTDNLRAFMESLNDAQTAKFSDLMSQLPKQGIFTEVGTGNAAVEGTAQAEVEAKIKVKMSENSKMKYSEALREVMSENEGLEERYDSELTPVRGKN